MPDILYREHVKKSLEDLLTEAEAIVITRLKHLPGQHDQSTHGREGEIDEVLSPQLKRVRDIGETLGIDRSGIEVVNESKWIHEGDAKGKIAGDYNQSTKKITIYNPSGMTDYEISGTLAHEHIHSLWNQDRLSSMIDAVEEKHEGKAYSNLKRTGKITKYAALHWDGDNPALAIEETLAEVGRLKAWGNYSEVPDVWRTAYEGYTK